MSFIFESLFCLVGLGLFLVLVMALLSPLEALGWWAGWSARDISPSSPAGSPTLPTTGQPQPGKHYVIYLTAIGGISAADISGRERSFLAKLSALVPGTVIVDDVFPFSVTNNPLNGERPLAWLWQRIHNSRMRGRGALISGLIFVRNLLQVAVSADPRYGPIYNVGVARELAKSLLAHGYPAGSGQPITIMGWSGGGQISVGTARYLHQSFAAPITVISIGGVIADEPGIADVAHLYHLNGSRDPAPHLIGLLWPGRWPLLRYSAWNRAIQAGRITNIDTGPMKHTGREDYFDRKSTLPDGQTYADRTVSIIAGIIAGEAAHGTGSLLPETT